ncbi:MAG: hypothetical protein NTW19_12725 [Planctomycetota bacterium]|nr:hypothetical protein [Planctomycetota bacterium]
MSVNDLVQEMLDRGWTMADLRRAAEILRELEGDGSMQRMATDLDAVRAVLGNGNLDSQPSGGWESYESRLRSAIAVRTREPRSAGRWMARAAWPAALAASLALAATGWALFLSKGSPIPQGGRIGPVVQTPSAGDGQAIRPPAPTPTNSFARMTEQDMAQQASIFEQVSKVFDERAGWVAVSGDDIEMGMTQKPTAEAPRVLLLRLAVSRGSTLLSRSDLAVVPGQDVDLTLPLADGKRLRYRLGTAVGTPARLSIWVELQTPGAPGQTLAAAATELSANPGDLLKVGQLATSSGEYQVDVGVFRAIKAVEHR